MSGNNERERLLHYLYNRFGIPAQVLDDYLFFRRKRAWFLIHNSPQLAYASRLKISKAGLRAFQRVGNFIKPTTRFIQGFGHHATKGVFAVGADQLGALLGGEGIPVDLPLNKGYVILTLGTSRILGLGFFDHHAIRSQLPRKELTFHLKV
ncbi:MAG: hypothetical protein ACOC79_04470 [Thermodesulfobacteriota bacterium]